MKTAKNWWNSWNQFWLVFSRPAEICRGPINFIHSINSFFENGWVDWEWIEIEGHCGPKRIENGKEMKILIWISLEWTMKRGAALFVWFLGQWALFGGVKGGSSRTATSPQRRRAAKEAKKWSWKQRLWVEWTKWRMNFIFVLMESMKVKWMKGMRVNETPPQGAKRSAASLSLFLSLLLARWSAIKKREEREESGWVGLLFECGLWAAAAAIAPLKEDERRQATHPSTFFYLCSPINVFFFQSNSIHIKFNCSGLWPLAAFFLSWIDWVVFVEERKEINWRVWVAS